MEDAGPLSDWYAANARDLPWRAPGTTPWAVLLSEIILQQTRMESGIPYWERIHSRWPNSAAMAAASEDDLLREWEGCGYYSRARNLFKLATEVGDSALPSTREELIRLPGIGPYTAAAIASIAFGEAVACVDGNVRRVLSRWAAADLSPAELQSRADAWMRRAVEHGTAPGDWNQALMELGAMVCSPRKPNCAACPMANQCAAAKAADATAWPARRKTRQKAVHMHAWVEPRGAGYHLVQSDARELGGLWGFPLHEKAPASTPVGRVRHDFTHKRWTVDVHLLPASDGEGVDPASVGMSRLHRKILDCAEAAR